ncbi:MAG: 1-acyl-sn-glycerol-3-phosphate acyltransferase [Bacilli bacterium]|nr:1-acyl-sn-glycerol-3-phosphate acyltransferase [Bacilli bacterium]
MKRREPKIVYYEDILNDDFAGTNIRKKPLPENFKYVHKNPIWFVLSVILYYVFAIPILWVVAKIWTSYRIVGKKKLKKAHFGLKGYFVYGNHTQIMDVAFGPISLSAPRKAFFVCHPDAVNIPLIRPLVMMLGATPLPDSPQLSERFIEAIKYRISHANPVYIFPEAHIWPYCTFIRPFPDNSFTYPASLGSPVVAMCTTYEEHKFFKFRKPRPVIHISNPIYPDMSKPLGERAHLLREAVYEYMVETSSSLDNVEYIRYVKK